MANTQAMCTSFKVELLNGIHGFGAGGPAHASADSFKAALYLTSATTNAANTVFTATGEVSGAGYTTGGVDLTGSPDWIAPTAGATTTAYTTPTASIVYTTVTLTTAFNCVMIYNSTQSNKAVSVHLFGDQTITAGTFTLTMPTNNETLGLLRIV